MTQQNIPLQQTKPVTCSACGCMFFTEVLLLRRVPALLTGQPKDGLVHIPAFRCSDCGEVAKQYLPQGLNNDNDQDPPEKPPVKPTTLQW